MASNQFKQLFFSQYITNGVEVAVGVGAVTLGIGAVFGVPVAATAASGAICVSIVDLPGPVRLKALQLVSATLLTTLISFIFSYARLNVWTELGGVFLISLFGGMLNAFGKKALALSFVCVFALVLGIGTPKAPGQEIEHALRFGGGAALYAIYAFIMASVLRYRTKHQALAEAMFELANYLDAKSAFFERDADINKCYGDLVAEQVNLVDKQQNARDLVFRHLGSARHVRLATILIGLLDVSERVFSSHTNYTAIHEHFADADVTMLIRDLIRKSAIDLRHLGYGVLRGRDARRAVIYKAELIAIGHELARLNGCTPDGKERVALDALDGVFARIVAAIGLIEELHHLVHAKPGDRPLPENLALLPFLSNMSFPPAVLWKELRFTSPVFRFSVRLTLAMAVGFGLSQFLPYSTHSYWILLTVAVILRANYSVTKQRRNDRILGTLLGCLFIALLLHFRPGYALEVVVMFFALGVAHAFATIKYRYTAAAACVMAVLQVHFLNPGAPFAIDERLIDTLVGALLAFAASYVLPSWEHLSMTRLISDLLKAHARYVTVVSAEDTPDVQYRLARKNLFDTIALTSAAFRRMLLEPRAHQRAVTLINDFITTSYSFASNMAALRLFLENDVKDRALTDCSARLANLAAELTRAFAQSSGAPTPVAAAEVQIPLEASEAEIQTATRLDDQTPPHIIEQLAHPHAALSRRLFLLDEQGRRIVSLARTIKIAMESTDPALQPAGTGLPQSAS
jgi:uncharacterized membrane protein YccC